MCTSSCIANFTQAADRKLPNAVADAKDWQEAALANRCHATSHLPTDICIQQICLQSSSGFNMQL
jgi:surface antigen